MGIPLYYSPLSSVQHGQGDEWVEKWENLIDFKSGFDAVPAGMECISARDALNNAKRSGPVIVAEGDFHFLGELFVDSYERVQDELRERCQLVSDPVAGVMAVHIRRGDIMRKERWANRRTSLEIVAERIRRYRTPDLEVHVFSQGDVEEFEALPEDCHLHLDGDVFDALRVMINAEVLMMAKSSLSYVAGVLSKGTVYYDPFWHRKLETWRNMEDGSS